MSSADPDTVVLPPKFSRYRSVRASGKNVNTSTHVTSATTSQDGGISRRPSRYHRPQAGKSGYDKIADDAPEMPAVPRAATMPLRRMDKFEAPIQEKSNKRTQRSDLERQGPLEELESELKTQGRRHAEALESVRQVSRDQNRRNESRPTRHEGEGIIRAKTIPIPIAGETSDEEAAEILKIQKQKDLERLERVLDNASPPKLVGSSREKFNLFSKKRSASKGTSTPSPPMSIVAFSRRPSADTAPEPQKRSPKFPLEQPKKLPQVQDKPHIEAGGGGVVPGIDAPVSAVNSGERVSFYSFL